MKTFAQRRRFLKWMFLLGFRVKKRTDKYRQFITYHRSGAMSVDLAGYWMTPYGHWKFQQQAGMLDKCFPQPGVPEHD